MKLFKTYPFTEREETLNGKASFYYKVLSKEGFEIVENIWKDKIRSVTYRKLDDINLEFIQRYHVSNYRGLELFQVEKELSYNVFKITDFKKGEGFRFFIFHINEQAKVQKHQWYDINFNLLEYQEELYSDGEHSKTKIFYPSSWNISIVDAD